MRIALITEGISEYRVLKHLLNKYFKGFAPEINQIQPKLTGEKQDGIGGWAKVLEYCARKDIRDILVENEYLVIQIDTDQSATSPFDVPHSTGSTKKSEAILYQDVEEKLRSLIQPAIWADFSDRILFAVSIHTTECWLLAIFKKSSTTNCLETLKPILIKEKLPKIEADKNSPQSKKAYEKILGNWTKRKEIEQSAAHNVSLKLFLGRLSAINPEFTV